MYQFLSDDELCKRGNTHFSDPERRTLFFTVTGNDTLYQNVGRIYDFEENAIKLEALQEPFLTGGIRSLIDLGFSLYGYGTCDVR